MCMKQKQLHVDVAVAFVDLFAILTTGFGKSLCYACLPASFNSTCILKQEQGYSIVMVVTPHLSIMKDWASSKGCHTSTNHIITT